MSDDGYMTEEYMTPTRLRYIVLLIVIAYALLLISVDVGFVLVMQQEQIQLDKMMPIINNKTPVTI